MAKKPDVFDMIGDALEWERDRVKAVRSLARQTGDVVSKTTETVVHVGTHVVSAVVAGIAETVRKLGSK